MLASLMLAMAMLGAADAEDSEAQLRAYQGYVIDSIMIETTGDTRASAVRRQLRLREGDAFDVAAWLADIAKMMNLGFFRHVATHAEVARDRRVQLRMQITEAWSLLPIFDYEGGSVPIVVFGVSDADVLGSMLEVGGYYLRRDTFNLARGWVVLPNLVLANSRLEVQAILDARSLLLYGGDPAQIDRGIRAHYSPNELQWKIPTHGFDIVRRGGFADLGVELIPDLLTVSGRYLFFAESTYTLTNVQEVADSENRGSGEPHYLRSPFREQKLSLLDANIILGRIDLVDNYLFRGNELRAIIVSSLPQLASDRSFTWTYLTYRGFANITSRLELGWRASAAHSTSHDVLDELTLGGDILDPFAFFQPFVGILTIRGFRATQFVGQNIYYLNVEPRLTALPALPLWFLGDAAFQIAAFADAGYAWDGDNPFARRMTSDVYVSVGGGLLASLLDLRYTYLNWYVAETLRPYRAFSFELIMTRPFF